MISKKGSNLRKTKNNKQKSNNLCSLNINENTKIDYFYLQPKPSRKRSIRHPPSDHVYRQIENSLAKISRRIDQISGDGNCLFRALSKEVFGSERFHCWLRNRIVDFMADNSPLFDQIRINDETMEAHLRRMRADGIWATTLELFAAASFFEKNIYLFTPAMNWKHYQWYHFRPLSRRRIRHSYLALCHTRGEHFDRIVPIDQFDNKNYRSPVSRGSLLKLLVG